MFENTGEFYNLNIFSNQDIVFSLLIFILFFAITFALLRLFFVKNKYVSLAISLPISLISVFYMTQFQANILKTIFNIGGTIILSLFPLLIVLSLAHSFESIVFRKLALLAYGVFYTFIAIQNNIFSWIVALIIISLIIFDEKIHDYFQEHLFADYST